MAKELFIACVNIIYTMMHLLYVCELWVGE